MYAEGKAVKVSPDYVDDQQSQWKAGAMSAKRIFVVGVGVHAADDHIWCFLEPVELVQNHVLLATQWLHGGQLKKPAMF